MSEGEKERGRKREGERVGVGVEDGDRSKERYRGGGQIKDRNPWQRHNDQEIKREGDSERAGDRDKRIDERSGNKDR